MMACKNLVKKILKNVLTQVCIFIILQKLGDHSRLETPVPIPNTEVKRPYADGTAVRLWESRSLPSFFYAFSYKLKIKILIIRLCYGQKDEDIIFVILSYSIDIFSVIFGQPFEIIIVAHPVSITYFQLKRQKEQRILVFSSGKIYSKVFHRQFAKFPRCSHFLDSFVDCTEKSSVLFSFSHRDGDF